MSGKQQPSALAYALPLIIALAAVGGFAAWKVSGAKASIGVTERAASVSGVIDEVVAAGSPVSERPRWLKGQTHAHTNNGPDSIEPVEAVLAYYADAGFDFVVLTDHNHVTVASGPPGLLVIPGAEITLNREKCDPMPKGAEKCAMHVNALFVDPAKANDAFLEPPATSIFDVYKAALETAKQLGGIAQLNHPNYHYTGADPELLVRLSKQGLRFIEVMNEAKDLNSDGDATHPSVEMLWDEALSRGAKLYAIASDDAHNYSDAAKVTAEGRNAALVNQGFIYVRAKKDPQSIRQAMERGDFYASNGVELEEVSVRLAAVRPVDGSAGQVTVRVAARHKDPLITVRGGGGVVKEVRSHELQLQLGLKPTDSVQHPFVRIVVEADGHRALTQPVFLR